MVDLSFLQKFTKGDSKKMKRYINMYLSIAPGVIRNMEQNITDQDWEQFRINAHSLKPQADYMGIPSLKSALVEIEQHVEKGKFERLNELYEKISILHANSIPHLKAFIDAPEG